MDAIQVIVTIGQCFVDPINRHCGYLFHYNSNIKDLISKIQDLHVIRKEIQLVIVEEGRNGQKIAPRVEAWIEKVGKILDKYVDEAWIETVRNIPDEDVVETWIERVRNILDEDVEANNSLGGWCPSYFLSRKAKKKTWEIDRLLSDAGPFFTRMSYPPPLGTGPSSIEGIVDFESRTKIRKEVLEALRADKVNIIAICGMGGIGKTTLAQEVEKRVKDENLFEEVVMAVVPQNQDSRKIQVQIAEMLRLELDAESSRVRADKLKSRLMGCKSVLVILDDVWDAIDLKAIGIPCGGRHNSCKILLTSRSEEACRQMETQKFFRMKVLTKEEAWKLFREMAGNCIDTPGLHQIAKEVAKKCGGLPVAITTVGRALNDKSEFEWSAALQHLKNASPKNILGLDPKAYSGIEFSYNYLKNEEAKSCFLLCCLFPEDYDIPIEVLVRYGWGQRLFRQIYTVAAARIRVHAIVMYLKRSFLLLDSEKGEQFVKMHDVVRAVAILIVENLGYLVRCNEKMEEWPEKDSCNRFNTISLVYKELKMHPDDLEWRKLELLQLLCDGGTSQILPPNLFKGMKGLHVLTLFGMSLPPLPQSINVLENLRTLQFVNCEITDVSAIGELKKLEILSFLNSKIKELPGEMRNLSHLKLLELTGCFDLERIPPDLLPKLSHLEELYMVGVDVMRKAMEEEEEKKGANASLTELMSLSYLVALKIQIPNIKVLPKDFPFKNETIKFQIFAGVDEKVDEVGYLFKNSLGLGSCDRSDIAESRTLLQLLKKSEILTLKEIKDIKNIAYDLDNEGFQCLKDLAVSCSDDVEYVTDATSYLTPPAAFRNLESLELEGLTNLKEICRSQFPDRSFSGAHFDNLKSLRLRTLPRLIGFCTGVDPVLLVQTSLNREVGRIDTNEVTDLGKHKVTEIQHTGPFTESTSIIFHKLFSSNTILWAADLENLELEGADSLEAIFDLEGLKVDEDHQRIAVLAQLKTLEVKSSSNLGHVWKNVPRGIQGFQKLTSIEVSECHLLRYLFPTSIAKLLVELQSIKIEECDAIENIVQRDGEENATDIIQFPKVSSLILKKLPNMMSFFIKDYSFEWPSIKGGFHWKQCPKLKRIGSIEAFSENDAEISGNKSRGFQELKANENSSVLIKKKKIRLKKRVVRLNVQLSSICSCRCK